MLVEECFSEAGSLFFEFVEWLVEEEDRLLARRVWYIVSTGDGELTKARATEAARRFQDSQGPDELDKSFRCFVGKYWPLMPISPGKREIDGTATGSLLSSTSRPSIERLFDAVRQFGAETLKAGIDPRKFEAARLNFKSILTTLGVADKFSWEEE